MAEAPPDVSAIKLSLPVTVLLERRMISRSFWSLPSWYLSGVVAGEGRGGRHHRGTKVRQTADGDEFAWSGHYVTLYKDACERYWHALIGDRPQVYVVSRDTDEVPGIEPWVVTVDYDEATAFAETDEQVLSCGITPELYRYMEAFVLHHYQPKEFKKRKRKKGSASNGVGNAGAGVTNRVTVP